MRKRFSGYGAALALILLMVLTAGWCGETEIVFPEILALAVGVWVADKPHWRVTPFTLWFAPTLAALFGVLLVRYSQLPMSAMIVLAFILTALLLNALRSNLMPAISAAILPILIGTSSWIYPLAVGVLTAVVALGGGIFGRYRIQSPASVEIPWMESHTPPLELTFWAKLLAVVAPLAVFASSTDMLFSIAPPLIVTFVEFSQRKSTFRQRPLDVFLLLAFAAWAGMICQAKLVLGLGWPVWISALLVMPALFIVYEWRGLWLPPAGAIALLPMLLDDNRLPAYPWQVMAGTAIFLLASRWLFRDTPEEIRLRQPTQ